MKRLALLLTLGLALTGSMARADVLTYSDTFTDLSEPLSGQTINLTQFDSATYGTLDSVTITLSNLQFTGTATKTGISRTFAIVVYDPVKLDDGNGQSVTVTLADAYTAKLSTTPNIHTVNQGSDVSTTFSTGLGIYDGTGTVTLNLTDSGYIFGSLVQTPTYSSTLSGTATVTYNYTPTPVPEPSQTVGLILAFGACLLVGRNYFRRQAQA